MYIILMRHGEAVPQTEDITNRERGLTPKGMRQARRSSRMLARFLKDHPIRIFTSPYVRTRQTAGILAEECFAEESIRPMSCSSPTGRWYGIIFCRRALPLPW